MEDGVFGKTKQNAVQHAAKEQKNNKNASVSVHHPNMVENAEFLLYGRYHAIGNLVQVSLIYQLWCLLKSG